MTSNFDKHFFRPSDAARRARETTSAIRAAIAEGRIGYVKIRGHFRIPRSELNRYLRSRGRFRRSARVGGGR